jgi:hypothetical protein
VFPYLHGECHGTDIFADTNKMSAIVIKAGGTPTQSWAQSLDEEFLKLSRVVPIFEIQRLCRHFTYQWDK